MVKIGNQNQNSPQQGQDRQHSISDPTDLSGESLFDQEQSAVTGSDPLETSQKTDDGIDLAKESFKTPNDSELLEQLIENPQFNLEFISGLPNGEKAVFARYVPENGMFDRNSTALDMIEFLEENSAWSNAAVEHNFVDSLFNRLAEPMILPGQNYPQISVTRTYSPHREEIVQNIFVVADNKILKENPSLSDFDNLYQTIGGEEDNHQSMVVNALQNPTLELTKQTTVNDIMDFCHGEGNWDKKKNKADIKLANKAIFDSHYLDFKSGREIDHLDFFEKTKMSLLLFFEALPSEMKSIYKTFTNFSNYKNAYVRGYKRFIHDIEGWLVRLGIFNRNR